MLNDVSVNVGIERVLLSSSLWPVKLWVSVPIEDLEPGLPPEPRRPALVQVGEPVPVPEAAGKHTPVR